MTLHLYTFNGSVLSYDEIFNLKPLKQTKPVQQNQDDENLLEYYKDMYSAF